MQGRLGLYWNRLAAFVERRQEIVACIAASLFLMGLHQSFALTQFHFDSGEYWSLASLDDLVNVKSGRGYVYPLLLAPLKFLCSLVPSPVLMYRGGMSVIYAVLLTVLLPNWFQTAFGGKLSAFRRLVPVVLLGAVFPGVLLYPLSDLPAVLLAFSALVCTIRAMEAHGSTRRLVLMLLAAGVLIGAAYNTRTIYMFTTAALGVSILLSGGRWRLSQWRLLGLASFVLGVVAISLPQLALNMRTHAVKSLTVQSDVNDRHIFAAHLVWGITLQKYETSLFNEGGSAQAFYLDRAGVRLFDEEVRAGNLFSMPHYFSVVARHPLEFLGIYTRHFINGLDVRDGIVYVQKPSPRRNRTAFLNFVVLILAAWVTLSIAKARGIDPNPAFRDAPVSWPLSLAMLLLPVAAVVPGAVETRYFLPLHLLAYCVIAMHFDWMRLRQHFRLHRRLLLLALVLTAGVFFAVTFSTMANMQYEWPDIYRLGPPS
jgi:hypothetical protein